MENKEPWGGASVIVGGITSYFIFMLIKTHESMWAIFTVMFGLIFIWMLREAINTEKREREHEKYEKMLREYAYEKRNREQEEERRRQNGDDYDLAEKIYRKCRQKGLTSIDTDENLQNLKIIAKSFDIYNLEIAKKYFRNGEKRVINEEIASRQKCDQDEFDRRGKKAKIKGVKKYTSKLEAEIISEEEAAVRADNDATRNEFMKEMAKTRFNHQAEVKNWGVAGGIADAIAGPAAGVATALSVQRENEENQRHAAEIREHARESYENCLSYENKFRSEANNHRSKVRQAKSILMRLEEKLYDDDDIQGLFDMIELPNNWKFTIRKSGNIEVCGSVTVKQPVEICNSKAALDGSLKISVYKDDICIGFGYYCAPGFDETNLSKVGFTSSSKLFINTVCIVNSGSCVTNTEGLYCKVEPVNMWKIEI